VGGFKEQVQHFLKGAWLRMSGSYIHLELSERALIETQLRLGMSPTAIAAGLKRARSTILREILACSGAPANATCSISPTSVTPSGTAASTATLSIQTDVTTAAVKLPGKMHGTSGSIPLVLLSGVALLGCTMVRRRRRNWWYVQLGSMLLLLAGSAVSGCGGSGTATTNSNKTLTGTYTITVTGTSGSAAQTATYSLTVQ
jgi:Helix-turn-helix domain